MKVRIIEAGGGVHRTLFEMRYPIRLGTSSFQLGMLKPDDIDETAGAFEEIAAMCRSWEVARTRVVATSAVRESTNRDELVEAVRRRTGIEIEIITGAEEARLLAHGLRAEMRPDQHNLLVDIGGGSTELIYTKPNLEIETLHTLRLGAVRLKEMVAPGNPPTRKEWALLETAVENQIEKSHLPAVARKTHVLGVAGTMRAVLDARRARFGDADSFSFRDIERILRDARSMTHEEMGDKLKLDARRAQIFLPGALIMRGIMELYGITRVSVSAGGLRDGLLQEMLDELDHGAPHDADLFALRIGEKYGFDQAHGEHVAALAVRLFDQTADLHKLDGGHRDLLRIAAMLHDIGQFVSYSGHHKHSHYLLLNEEFPGLILPQQEVVAAVSRYHRKSAPTAKHPEFAGLRPESREAVEKLAAILRIADGLDREHRQLVEDLEVSVAKDGVEIACRSSHPIPLELSSARRKAELFQKVFGRRVSVKGMNSASQDSEQGE